MPARGDDLVWIDLADFTPGIMSGYQTGGLDEMAKDGAAQVRDTWGCVSMPGGGLAPAPRQVDNTVATDFTDVDNDPNTFNSETLDSTLFPLQPTSVRVHAFIVQPLINVAGDWGDAAHQLRLPDALMWAVEYYYSVGATLKTRMVWWLLDQMSNTLTRIADETSTVAGASGISRANVTSPQWGTADLTMVYSSYGATPNPTFIGIPFAAWSSAVNDSGGWFQYGGYYGDPYNVTQPNAIFKDRGQGGFGAYPITYRMTVHNDRLCHTASIFQGSFLPDPTAWANGDSTADDTIFYLGINNLQEFNPLNLIQLSSRGIDSIGAMISGPGNQLFILRNKEGGALITGSMEQPTVQQFPGVESVGNYPNKPVVTPIGVVYGTATGVFSWPGGDHSMPLGTGLQGPFWLTKDMHGRDKRHPVTPCGTFAYRHPYVYAPNNWIFDTRTSGWFRLFPDETQDETLGIDLGHFQIGYGEIVYGCQTEIRRTQGTERNGQIVVSRFDQSRPAAKWSWRSQPLARARNRILKARELIIVASGYGTITATIIGANDVEQTVTFDIPNVEQPTIIRRPISIDVMDPEIRIVAEEVIEDGNVRLHRMSLGFHETTSTNRGDS